MLKDAATTTADQSFSAEEVIACVMRMAASERNKVVDRLASASHQHRIDRAQDERQISLNVDDSTKEPTGMPAVSLHFCSSAMTECEPVGRKDAVIQTDIECVPDVKHEAEVALPVSATPDVPPVLAATPDPSAAERAAAEQADLRAILEMKAQCLEAARNELEALQRQFEEAQSAYESKIATWTLRYKQLEVHVGAVEAAAGEPFRKIIEQLQKDAAEKAARIVQLTGEVEGLTKKVEESEALLKEAQQQANMQVQDSSSTMELMEQLHVLRLKMRDYEREMTTLRKVSANPLALQNALQEAQEALVRTTECLHHSEAEAARLGTELTDAAECRAQEEKRHQQTLHDTQRALTSEIERLQGVLCTTQQEVQRLSADVLSSQRAISGLEIMRGELLEEVARPQRKNCTDLRRKGISRGGRTRRHCCSGRENCVLRGASCSRFRGPHDRQQSVRPCHSGED